MMKYSNKFCVTPFWALVKGPKAPAQDPQVCVAVTLQLSVQQ